MILQQCVLRQACMHLPAGFNVFDLLSPTCSLPGTAADPATSASTSATLPPNSTLCTTLNVDSLTGDRLGDFNLTIQRQALLLTSAIAATPFNNFTPRC
jgi:hypothetical protein